MQTIRESPYVPLGQGPHSASPSWPEHMTLRSHPPLLIEQTGVSEQQFKFFMKKKKLNYW